MLFRLPLRPPLPTAAAVAELFFADQTLGGRVCDLQIGTIRREFASINGQPFALARIPLTINPTG